MLCFLFGGFPVFVLTFISFGFVVSIAIKEVRNKEEYLFYYNNGFSKVQLWIFSAILNAVCALLLLFLCVLILK